MYVCAGISILPTFFLQLDFRGVQNAWYFCLFFHFNANSRYIDFKILVSLF
jgi:hypothetical protein